MRSASRSRSRLTANSHAGSPAARALAVLAAAWVLGQAPVATAAPEVFTIDPALTRAEFAVGHFWVTRLEGRFGRTQGTIVLDAEGHAGSIDFAVDATSVDTGWSVRDNFIRGEHMFDSARYPTVRFRSTQLTFDRVRLIGAAGELTMHNVTRPIAIKVERLECGPHPDNGREGCGVAVISSIKRSDFGMTVGLPFVGDDIDLSFYLTAFRAAP